MPQMEGHDPDFIKTGNRVHTLFKVNKHHHEIWDFFLFVCFMVA